MTGVTDPAATAAGPGPGQHYWEHRHQAGRKLTVRMCKLCPAIDWDGLDEQAEALAAAGQATITSLTSALREAGAQIGRRYAMGAAAERQRLAAVIPPEQFRAIAGWFDTDEFKEMMFPGTRQDRGHEMQDDLRKFAQMLGGIGG